MLLSQHFTAHLQGSRKQKPRPQRVLEVLDFMLAFNIIFHIFNAYCHASDCPYVLSSLPLLKISLPKARSSTDVPKSILLFLPKDIIPVSSLVPLLFDHPHQHVNTSCLMYVPTHGYVHGEGLTSPYLTPTPLHFSIPLTLKRWIAKWI